MSVDVLRQVSSERADMLPQGHRPAHDARDGNQAVPVRTPGVQVADREATDAELQLIAILSRLESDYVAGTIGANEYLFRVALASNARFSAFFDLVRQLAEVYTVDTDQAVLVRLVHEARALVARPGK